MRRVKPLDLAGEPSDMQANDEQMWRATDRAVCEVTTPLSKPEHAYVATRVRMLPGWVINGVVDESFRVWCPLQRGHDGPHTGRVGWADQFEQFTGSDYWGKATWFITWGPHDTDPRSIAPLVGCRQNYEDRADGTSWHCPLMNGHSGECRLSQQVFSLDVDGFEDLGINLSSNDDSKTDAEVADQNAEREQRIADAYRLGDWTLGELAEDWWITKYQVTRIVERLLTDDERFAANARRWDANGLRKSAETDLAGAERARLLQGGEEPEVPDEPVPARWSPTNFPGVGLAAADHHDGLGGSSQTDESKLIDLALRLTDLNPVTDSDDFGSTILIRFDPAAELYITISTGDFDFGVTIELPDGSAFSGDLDVEPTADVAEAEKTARGAITEILQMPQWTTEMLAIPI